MDRKIAYILAMAALLAKKSNGIRFRGLEVFLGLAPSALSQAAFRMEIRMRTSGTLSTELAKLQTELFLANELRNNERTNRQVVLASSIVNLDLLSCVNTI